MDTRTSEQRSVLSYPPFQCDTSLARRDALHNLAALTDSDVEKPQIISTGRSSTAERSSPMIGTLKSHSRFETWGFPTRPSLPTAHRPALLTQLLCLPLRIRYIRLAVLCHIQTRQVLGHPRPPQARCMVRYVRIHIIHVSFKTTQIYKVRDHCRSTPATDPY